MSEIANRLRDRAAERRRVGWEISDAMTPGEMEAAAAEIERLRHPFRNADRMDWDHLFRMLPDSGHGRFWKAVLMEMRDALTSASQ